MEAKSANIINIGDDDENDNNKDDILEKIFN